MANSAQATKRARQAENRRIHNHAMRARMRTSIKAVRKAIESGDRAAADGAYAASVPVIDSLAHKGLVHRNTAARYKSRLNARLRSMQA